MLKLEFHGTIRGDVKRRLKSAVRRADIVLWIRHNVRVIVVAGVIQFHEDAECGFGAFRDGEDGPKIYLCGLTMQQLGETRITTKESLRMIVETLAHELVHYEQFRDEKTPTERGVAVRMRSILKLMQAR